MYRSFILLLLILVGLFKANAQELNCKVVINADKVQTMERQVFSDMQTAFTRFLNTRRWTNDQFKAEERINCTLILNFNPTSSLGLYNASAQIQSSRPVYGTSYNTVLFNFLDKNFEFEYVQSQPLDYNDNGNFTHLTAMLAFYAYVIIGLDYDSFSKMGGNPYFQKALNVVNNAQQFNTAGWAGFDGNQRNRYWVSENLSNQQFIPLREGMYTYHRLALDDFQKDPEKSRTQIIDILNKIKVVKKQKPNSVLINAFFDAKMDELIKIFSEASPQLKQQAYTLLSDLDPTNTDKYKKLIGG
jgi:hypothetical protein